jgi:capsular polysaccharide transport system ATP-binding protein
MIMVSHGEGTLRQFCSAGIWLHEGKAHWFDQIDDAIAAYKESMHLK